jgi:probable HAF family extracellular repeat protein
LAFGINDAGQIVGGYRDSSGIPHGFLYSGGVYTTINDPLGTNGTFAFGINNKSQIVGEYIDSSGIPHGFLYSGGVYTTINDPLGTNGTVAQGINDKGQIVGYYLDSRGIHGFLATPTEEEDRAHERLHGTPTYDANDSMLTGVHVSSLHVGDFLFA